MHHTRVLRPAEGVYAFFLEGLEQFTSSLTPEQRTRLMAALSDLPHRI